MKKRSVQFGGPGPLAGVIAVLAFSLASCGQSNDNGTTIAIPSPCALATGVRTYLVYPQPDSNFAPGNFNRIVVVSNRTLPLTFQALVQTSTQSRYYLPLNKSAHLPYPTPTPNPSATPTPIPTPTPTSKPSPAIYQASRNPGITWAPGVLQVYLGSQATQCNPALYLGQFTVIAPTPPPAPPGARHLASRSWRHE